MTPSRAAIDAAEDVLLEIREAKPNQKGYRKTGRARRAAIEAAIAVEDKEVLSQLARGSNELLMRFVIELLDDLRCVEKREAIDRYDATGWGSGKTAMPNVSQIREWIEALINPEEEESAEETADSGAAEAPAEATASEAAEATAGEDSAESPAAAEAETEPEAAEEANPPQA